MNRHIIARGVFVALVAFAAFAVWKSRHSPISTAGQLGANWKLVFSLPQTNGQPAAPTNK